MAGSGCAVLPSAPDAADGAALTAGPPLELTATSFYPQSAYQCGPAALATVLDDAGVAVDLADLVQAVWIPGRRGSLTTELVAATRRAGRLAVRLPPDTHALRAVVADGYPVLVLLNLGVDWLPVWHYAVVIGFTRDGVVLRSGTQRRRVIAADDFARHWAGGNRWAMVAAHPAVVPDGLRARDWVQAVADRQEIAEHRAKPGRDDGRDAVLALEAAARRWPDAALVHFALGNARAAADDWWPAHAAFARAVALRGDWAAALNNLAATQTALGCPDRALATLARVPDPTPSVVAQTRAEALATPAGDCRLRDTPEDAPD